MLVRGLDVATTTASVQFQRGLVAESLGTDWDIYLLYWCRDRNKQASRTRYDAVYIPRSGLPASDTAQAAVSENANNSISNFSEALSNLEQRTIN